MSEPKCPKGMSESEWVKQRILSYKNPDPHCRYPYTPDPLGYCWSFAHHVDGTPGWEDMGKICHGCDSYARPSRSR